jgi:hypothetical protein
MVRRDTAYAITTALGALLAAVSPSCGSHQHRDLPPSSGKLPPGAGWVSTPRVAGNWEWAHISEQDGIRRVEVERWSVALAGTQVTGAYDRTVTFLSLDGVPFDCNQNLTYDVKSHYQVSGTAHARWVELRETDVNTAASPCDDGYRNLARYEAFVTDDGLLLIWRGGSQTLHRAGEPAAAPAAPAAALAGSWVWRHRDDDRRRGEVRVESEDWELAEDASGRLTGTYLRDVTVFHPDGGIYACSGAGYYRFRDRYTLVGEHDGDELTLNEIAVDAEPNPCVAQEARHLDAAGGRLNGAHLELVWRGGHRQVLHRPDGPVLPALAER